jgi:hypothetical protein
MLVKAWRGGSCGIRVGKSNANRYFSRDWKEIEVEIGGRFERFRLSATFWEKCPEFRGAVIDEWLSRQGLLPWPKGKPPGFQLVPIRQNRFRLLRIEPPIV